MERRFDIYLNEPHQSGRELEFLREVLESNWLATEGNQLEHFHRELLHYYPGKSIVLTNSGTSALHLALLSLGIGEGDFVICQSFTFVASANPILYTGATPVFVDSELETWNMDPVELEHAIHWCENQGKIPKAVIMVHSYGMPAKVEEILTICRNFSIPLIEDAAEALGSYYKGVMPGNFGQISILSFNGNKIVTSTSGGAMITDSKEFLSKATRLASQSKDELYPHLHLGIGYNYRMSNICAAIGHAQVTSLEERVMRKRLIYELYRSHLGTIAGVSFQSPPTESSSNHWLNAMIFRDTETSRKIFTKLARHHVECRPLWKPVHQMPHFNKFPFFGKRICESLHLNGLVLPSGTGLTEIQIERIINLVSEEVK